MKINNNKNKNKENFKIYIILKRFYQKKVKRKSFKIFN